MSSTSASMPLSPQVTTRRQIALPAARGGLDSYRRLLQIALGVIWLLDAALQYQPYMFTKAFPQQVLAPTGPGNPGWVAHPVHWAAHLTAEHVVFFDAVFATVQLLIALGMLSRRTVRYALVGSVLWALGIWWMGEGLGGVLAGPQSPVMGAPGAAIIYALISVLVWPRADASQTLTTTGSVATRSPLSPVLARLAWLVLWGSFAFESLQAANRSPSALHDMIAGMEDGEAGWLQAVDRGFARLLAHHGTQVSIGLAVVFALVAVSVFASARITRAGLVTAVALAALIWLVGENLGEISTGQATDPNSGPLLVLLAAAFWPLTRTAGATSAVAAET
jgi:hypothetical protein